MNNKLINNVLLLYPAKSVTAYWMVGKYALDYLKMNNNITNYTEKTPQEVTQHDIEKADIIYDIRCIHTHSQHLLYHTKKLDKPFIYFADDNFFMFPENCTQEMKTNIESAIEFVSKVDAIIVITKYLYDILIQYNPNTYLFQPFQYMPSKLPETKTNKITIGHMSTLSREKHFDFVIPAIKRILEEFDNQVCFESIGYKPIELSGLKNVTHFDFIIDYDEFLKFFSARHWDIGLAPLRDDPISRGKSNNKFREFGASKICGIYSDVKCYTDFVKHQQTGYIVENTEEAWYDAMKELIINTNLRNNIIQAANQYVIDNFRIEDFYKRLLSVFNLPYKPKQVTSPLLHKG